MAIAGVAIFEATRPIRPSDIPRLGTIIGGFAFVEGVAEEFNHPTVRPMAPCGLPRRNALRRETSMNGIRTPRLHYAPALDRPDHLGFRLVDHQVLWGLSTFAPRGRANDVERLDLDDAATNMAINCPTRSRWLSRRCARESG